MSNDSPVTVVPQLQFLSEKPLRKTNTNTNTYSKSTSTSVSVNSALRGAATATASATASTADDMAVADEKVVANIGTNVEADPLSHAIRVLLYRYEFYLISTHSILTVPITAVKCTVFLHLTS